jgi:excinuclease UvrABC helicase subunit UvrB
MDNFEELNLDLPISPISYEYVLMHNIDSFKESFFKKYFQYLKNEFKVISDKKEEDNLKKIKELSEKINELEKENKLLKENKLPKKRKLHV